MKTIVIDGQGGKMGKLIVERFKQAYPDVPIIAIGTNSIATSVMLKAGADYGATGENPVAVNCVDADVIIGPIGIVMANSLLGEITPIMAEAVGKSKALKMLIPLNRCNVRIAGQKDLSIAESVQLAMNELKTILDKKSTEER